MSCDHDFGNLNISNYPMDADTLSKIVDPCHMIVLIVAGDDSEYRYFVDGPFQAQVDYMQELFDRGVHSCEEVFQMGGPIERMSPKARRANERRNRGWR